MLKRFSIDPGEPAVQAGRERRSCSSLTRGANVWNPCFVPRASRRNGWPRLSAADIRSADSERLLVALMAPVEVSEEDQALAARLLTERSPEDIAAALVHAHRSRLPSPEDLLSGERAEAPRGPRPGFEGSIWFRMNIGRNQNADPRWILPLLCRRGHLSRGDIGAIRISRTGNTVRGARPRSQSVSLPPSVGPLAMTRTTC